MSTTSINDPDAYPETGLDILIVGGGVAGLAFAIEAKRKGHAVRIIERRPDFEDYGDLIAIQASALHTPKKWPGFMEKLVPLSFEPYMHIYKYDGTLIGKFPLGTPETPSLALNRSDFHNLLYEYSQSVGIQVEFNAIAMGYYETTSSAGVTLLDGRDLGADLVVAADGVGSRSWRLVVGEKETPISSGYGLYRVSFPAGPAMENPTIAKEFERFQDKMGTRIGPDVHVVISKTKESICWVLTHKDDGNAEETWTKTTSSDKALPFVEGWCPFVKELINATPDHKVTDWKLMWRNPQPKWVSPYGRVVQIGDSAHAFLPSSGSGATMALEDAYSLAACLQLSGKSSAPLATQIHNILRFERVSCAQKMGFKNREKFHKTDWEAVDSNPETVGKPIGSWVLYHDPEKYVYDKYEDCAQHVLTGRPFKNTNAVPGYTYKPWTAAEMIAASERGEMIIDQGDW
ncbi:hypothetical protein FE257_006226 [Aspergillus nanangensis]|uniref:FAD-binding domain-containing protein n=1 Tax=Aspergillus nanangensis TaxID=2582783 RepID=A0AAD4CAB6_ASPNN|nr:hypothetical protein FE257_006226 [Aspergillus nanangensis]